MIRHLIIGSFSGFLLAGALSPVAAAPAPAEAQAGDYDFAAPPGTGFNRIYSVNRATGDVGACQFAPKEGSIGTTVCFPAGDGAGSQAVGDYALIASNSNQEGGLFRINKRTGEISVCYVANDKVVCTAPAR
jgi:hypothetical protein